MEKYQTVEIVSESNKWLKLPASVAPCGGSNVDDSDFEHSHHPLFYNFHTYNVTDAVDGRVLCSGCEPVSE